MPLADHFNTEANYIFSIYADILQMSWDETENRLQVWFWKDAPGALREDATTWHSEAYLLDAIPDSEPFKKDLQNFHDILVAHAEVHHVWQRQV